MQAKLLARVMLLSVALTLGMLLGSSEDARAQLPSGPHKVLLPLLIQQTPPCLVHEPNNTLPGFGPLAARQQLYSWLCPGGDYDLFYINAPNEGELVINLELPPALVNHTSLWLFSQDNQPLFGDDTISTISTTMSYTMTQAGIYRVSVYSFDGSGDALRSYRLSLDFAECYPLLLTSSTQGTLVPQTPFNCGDGSQRYRQGSQVQVQAQPATGYTFGSWGGACAGQPNPCTLTLNRPLEASASFTLKTYTLSVSATHGWTTNPSGQVSVQHNVPRSISVSYSAVNCNFNGWVASGSGVSIAQPGSTSTTVRLTNGNAGVVATFSCRTG